MTLPLFGMIGFSLLPVSTSDAIVRLLAVVGLIALNAFFVAAEFSIVSVRQTRINQLAAVGDVQAKTIQSLQRSIERLLTTTQLGITLASLALGWIGENTLALLISHWLGLTSVFATAVVHSVSLVIAFLSLAYLQIVLGELLPKSLALLDAERAARIFGPISLSISWLFSPVVWLLNQSTRGLLRCLGVSDRRQSGDQLTLEELQMIISTPTAVLDLDQEERDILNNVFETRDFTVEDIMVPRTQIVALSCQATWKELLTTVSTTGHTQFPLIGDSLDDISGLIDFKAMAAPLGLDQLQSNTLVKAWMQPTRVVPRDLPLSDLLGHMQHFGHSMMIVVDDYGGTAGLVTWDDVTAELIGDTASSAADGILQLDDHSAVVTAQMDIDEVNEQFGLGLPSTDEYQTLAGFIISKLEKIPEAGESLAYDDGLTFTVTSVKGPKVEKIQIQRRPQPLRRRRGSRYSQIGN